MGGGRRPDHSEIRKMGESGGKWWWWGGGGGKVKQVTQRQFY